MEFLVAIALTVGALWVGYKIGTDAGRTTLLDAQSQSIGAELSNNSSDFYRKFGLHGSYLLPGHEYRSPCDFVIVKFSDLKSELTRNTETVVEDLSDDTSAVNASVSEHIYTPTRELARIVGSDPLTRTEATKRVWNYIESHGLQDSQKRIQINCDERLLAIAGHSQCSMFQLTKTIKDHLQ